MARDDQGTARRRARGARHERQPDVRQHRRHAHAPRGAARRGGQQLRAVHVRQGGHDALFDTRDIQWQQFDPKTYAAAIQPTDAEIEAYYKAHAAAFVAPEQARIEYLVLDAAALQGQVKADPTVVAEYYKQNAKAYTTPEERRASHILINVAPNATPADVDKAKAQAESVLAEVRKNPAAFADVAKKSSQDTGSAGNGGDLDFMTNGAILARSATRCSR